MSGAGDVRSEADADAAAEAVAAAVAGAPPLLEGVPGLPAPLLGCALLALLPGLAVLTALTGGAPWAFAMAGFEFGLSQGL